jgi:phage terminase large subunit-like protein
MPSGGKGAITKARREELRKQIPKTPPAWKRKGLTRASRVMTFLESLPITKGHLRGQRMKLLPEQAAFIEDVYVEDHSVSIGILSTPKGNGKTGLSAGLGLCHLIGPEAIPRGEVYSAAVDGNQSRILFDEMEAIIYEVPDFTVRTNIVSHFGNISVIEGDSQGSEYEALRSDARLGHGLAPSFWVYDELGLVKHRELLSALEMGMGKQPGALGIIISVQAADDDHPLSELIDDGLEGLDPSVVVHLHAAPEDAPPFEEKTWLACNFALGEFLSLDEFRKEAMKAKRIPSILPHFRNYMLNQRVAADERLISRDDWAGCKGRIDLEALRGRKCWAGLDLSSTTDLTALVLVFEPLAPAGPMPVVAYFWMPQGKVAEMTLLDRKHYGAWVELGLIEATAGRANDKMAIVLRLAEITKHYDLQVIGYDDWRFADLAKLMFDEGLDLPLRPVRQGTKTMTPMVDELERAVIDREIVHDGNPVLTSHIASAVAYAKPTGERKLDKKRSRARIDGAVCLAMALGLKAVHADAADDRPFAGRTGGLISNSVQPRQRRSDRNAST